LSPANSGAPAISARAAGRCRDCIYLPTKHLSARYQSFAQYCEQSQPERHIVEREVGVLRHWGRKVWLITSSFKGKLLPPNPRGREIHASRRSSSFLSGILLQSIKSTNYPDII
jgi:hypothetical protein